MSIRPSGMLAIALDSVAEGERILLDRFGSDDLSVRSKSSSIDVVTDADVASEDAIRASILSRRPHDHVIGEERGSSGADDGIRWVLDPLDSTANFARGIPIWSISLAAVDDDGPIASVVSCPTFDERFTGSRATPLSRNGRRIHERVLRDLDASIAAVGWGRGDTGDRQALVAKVLSNSLGKIRSPGSPALGLAWTAAGRFDVAYYEMNFKEWDIAAGIHLCECAGLEVRRTGEGRGEGMPRLLVAAPDSFETLEPLLFDDLR